VGKGKRVDVYLEVRKRRGAYSHFRFALDFSYAFGIL
jgi:hypothetical protein